MALRGNPGGTTRRSAKKSYPLRSLGVALDEGVPFTNSQELKWLRKRVRELEAELEAERERR